MSLRDDLLQRKPIKKVDEESGDGGLARTIGVFQLTMFGVGATIGTGIFFIMSEAVPVAGPAVIYAAALTCELTFYSLVTTLLSTRAVQRRYVGARVWIDRIAAAMIGTLGLMLIIRH